MITHLKRKKHLAVTHRTSKLWLGRNPKPQSLILNSRQINWSKACSLYTLLHYNKNKTSQTRKTKGPLETQQDNGALADLAETLKSHFSLAKKLCRKHTSRRADPPPKADGACNMAAVLGGWSKQHEEGPKAQWRTNSSTSSSSLVKMTILRDFLQLGASRKTWVCRVSLKDGGLIFGDRWLGFPTLMHGEARL